MTVTQAPWVWIVVLSLAFFGVVFVLRWARDAARDARAWLRRDRVTPLLEDEPFDYCECCEALGFDPHAGLEGGYCRGCGHWHGERLELPPERSAEDLGFTAEAGGAGSSPAWVPGRRPVFPGVSVDSMPALRSATFLERLEARRERLAGAAELEHRAAYEACGFEFPSGLMARVRERAVAP